MHVEQEKFSKKIRTLTCPGFFCGRIHTQSIFFFEIELVSEPGDELVFVEKIKDFFLRIKTVE